MSKSITEIKDIDSFIIDLEVTDANDTSKSKIIPLKSDPTPCAVSIEAYIFRSLNRLTSLETKLAKWLHDTSTLVARSIQSISNMRL